MDTKTAKTALITGASSGIGKELAILFAKDSYNLVLVASNEQALECVAQELTKTYNIKATVIAKDLSKQQGVLELIEFIESQQIKVDVLVNNAGFATSGNFTDIPLTVELDMLSVNIRALVMLSKHYSQKMLKAGYGHIINISSVAGVQPGPFMAVYAASKAFVLSFSAALNEELKGSGVTVAAICPGPAATNFGKRSGMDKTRLFNGFYPLLTAKAVAKVSYKTLKKGGGVYIAGVFNKIIVLLIKLLPRRVNVWVLRFLQNR